MTDNVNIFRWSLIFALHFIWVGLIIWLIEYSSIHAGFITSGTNIHEWPAIYVASIITRSKFRKTYSRNFNIIEMLNISVLVTMFAEVYHIIIFVYKYNYTFGLKLIEGIILGGVLEFALIALTLFFTNHKFKGNTDKSEYKHYSSVLEGAKHAYLHRRYDEAYKLFCQAENIGPLDSMSQRFKEQSKKRIENV